MKGALSILAFQPGHVGRGGYHSYDRVETSLGKGGGGTVAGFCKVGVRSPTPSTSTTPPMCSSATLKGELIGTLDGREEECDCTADPFAQNPFPSVRLRFLGG